MAEENHRWLIETGRLSDFKLICQGKEIHVHKTMLASHSKYFETLFSSGFKENIDGVVVFEDVESELMRHLLDYFYKGTTEWNAPKADLELHVRLWILADLLEASTVMLTIEKRMMDALSSYQSKPQAIKLIDLVFAHQAWARSAIGYTLSEAAWVLYLDRNRPFPASCVENALCKYHDLAVMTNWWSSQYARFSNKNGKAFLSTRKELLRDSTIEVNFTKTSRD
ncbi:BTB/POZ protein [Colletotrichum godetiae]|uniref:BTB/POZ protein n=1 Tax=Colletotrichum godetiae TaxID=1209918 RepID=A0AAJ0AZV4_9PEZI|nr:BTB/POZ protein [Colletotrichum godetiae]KAK1701367.1 BTB/POZ protein [Colletotrichum godetiae]